MDGFAEQMRDVVRLLGCLVGAISAGLLAGLTLILMWWIHS